MAEIQGTTIEGFKPSRPLIQQPAKERFVYRGSNIRDIPTPGFRYEVKSGDALGVDIERTAYGRITGTLESANPFLDGRPIAFENRPIIYPGDILNIPVLAGVESLRVNSALSRLTDREPDQITLVIADREIPFETMRILRTMDTVADGFTATIAWAPGLDPELDRVLLPFSYPKSQVYIGNTLIINGSVYAVSPEVGKEGVRVTIEGFSLAADLVDSNKPKPPYEKNNITLENWARILTADIGIQAEFSVASGGAFDRVTISPDEKVAAHLTKLAAQRRLLISSTNTGNLLFQRADTSGPVGTLQESQPLPIGWGAKFDGRKMYNMITAYGQSPGNPSKKATAISKNINRFRFLNFEADETTIGNVQNAAKWKLGKQLAEALELPFPVSGFYAPDGNLWRENTSVTVISPSIFVPQGFDFLIRSVEYTAEPTGKTTTLNLVPPQVYTGEELDFPWRAQ